MHAHQCRRPPRSGVQEDQDMPSLWAPLSAATREQSAKGRSARCGAPRHSTHRAVQSSPARPVPWTDSCELRRRRQNKHAEPLHGVLRIKIQFPSLRRSQQQRELPLRLGVVHRGYPKIAVHSRSRQGVK
eukprot:scaffold14553_cov120-Isochrysis_galbana.AAC.9